MNITDTSVPGPAAASTSFTPVHDADLTSDLALVTVIADGDTVLSTTSEGWTLLATAHARQGNLQYAPVKATMAQFAKQAPGTNEILVVDSTASLTFAAIVSRISAA